MNELETILRFLYAPNDFPDLETPYDPAGTLQAATEAANAALNRLESIAGFDIRDDVECTQTAYATASAEEGFDRGFRAGARLILLLIQSPWIDVIPA